MTDAMQALNAGCFCVSLDEDLNAGGLAFLTFLAVPLAASALVGATVGELIARWRHPDRQ